MNRIRISTTALHHLEEIHRYIAEDNPDAAARTIDSILNAIGRLADYPQLGRIGREGSTRELVHPPFVIAYKIHGDVIAITAVFHGNRRYV